MIERDDFPFELLSEIAEAESWRKEIYRPVYHVHKWWAQRLGSIFRAIIIGAAPGQSGSVLESFYKPVDLDGLVVFDPFMGSGTTVGEAVRLGCAAVGRDINPVAYNAVRVGLGNVERDEVAEAYARVEKAVASKICALYRAKNSAGTLCDVLYHFWVKVVDCPACTSPVDLFSTYVFAKHAYVKRYPTVHFVCPGCGDVSRGMHHEQLMKCQSCGTRVAAHEGPARGANATCTSCAHEFAIAETVRASGQAPKHRQFAKLVIDSDGRKEYVRATDEDRADYEKARRLLKRAPVICPKGELAPGHNTKQALNYCYRTWRDFFNERQLLALGLIAAEIDALPKSASRDALAIVFSGALEFNNLFASYKGEGTGAVRHMFSHHILKPERMPIEGNPWGWPQSSGAFSTLFRSRLLRALDYRDAPFEVRAEPSEKGFKAQKVFGCSVPVSSIPQHAWAARPSERGIFLSCGDSSKSGLADESVDLIVTDPPFFDNVHYSELADFFYAWQRTLMPTSDAGSTRQTAEVQDRDATAFANKLASVFRECHRVLRRDGLLVFSYHHSRDDGWSSLVRAIQDAGFRVTQAQPVKAEMSLATPKGQAADPIDLDILIVCRKQEVNAVRARPLGDVLAAVQRTAATQMERFAARGRALSRNDIKVLVLSRLLVELSVDRAGLELVEAFEKLLPASDSVIEAARMGKATVAPLVTGTGQLSLGL